MAAKKLNYKIPFDIDGNVPHWAPLEEHAIEKTKHFEDMLKKGLDEYKKNFSSANFQDEEHFQNWVKWHLRQNKFDWREPVSFEDTLLISSYSRGRSAAYFTVESKITNMKCCMFLTDLLDVIANKTIDKGVVSGKWIFCKRGQNYGIKLAE